MNDSSKLPNSLWRDPTLQAIPVSVRLLTDRQFEEHQDKLMSFLARSLDARNKPEELLELQAEMASFLLGAQGEQKRLEAELGESAVADRGHHDSPGVVVEVCKRLQGIVRQIADGIAWRTLRYDRPMLRILALKPPTGHMELASAKTEFIAAADVVETGELVVVNDLTNFLRYGDLTSVGEDGVTIIEVTGGPGAAKSGRKSRQKRKTENVLEFIRRGFQETDNGPQKIVDLKTEPVAHLDELRTIISEAWKRGAAQARVSDSLAVFAFDTIQMSELRAKGTNFSALVRDPFEQSKESLTFDSLKHFGRFTHNVAPYSIFRLAYEDRFAIMTGRLWVVSSFNFGNLYRCLRRRDLLVIPPREEGYAELEGLFPGEVAARELENPLVVSRGPPHPVLKIPMSMLARLFYELMDEESFADAVEEQLDLAGQEDVATFIQSGYRAEAQLWD